MYIHIRIVIIIYLLKTFIYNKYSVLLFCRAILLKPFLCVIRKRSILNKYKKGKNVLILYQLLLNVVYH